MKTGENTIGKKAQTVLGPINVDDLGITLPHEHLLLDMKIWFTEPTEATLKQLAYEKIKLKNLFWVIYNQYNNLDNMQLFSEEDAIHEAMIFKNEGGGTIVDVTTPGLGRDPLALARISRATGLNIIMASGHYVGAEGSSVIDQKHENDLANEITNELIVGVETTGIRSGIIGEIGCTWPLLEREKKVLKACAIAQNNTGAAITIHPGRHEDSPMEILKTLESAGADLTHVIMGHIDRTGFQLKTILELANTGCYLEYDTFGIVPFYPLKFGLFNRPCDRERIEQIMELMNRGLIKQILISQDTCLKTKLTRFGGGGYAHILRNILPQMFARGFTHDDINIIMKENPKKFLSIVKKST